MSTHLRYAKLNEQKLGFWSIRQKIKFATGYDCKSYQTDSGFNLVFTQDLTEQEIGAVDSIVLDQDAQGPDVSLQIQNNTFIMRDIWVYRNEIAAEAGFDFSIWFRSSGTFGPNVMDEIVIIPTDPTHTMQRLLTNPQKNNLINAIKSGDRWE